MSPLRTDPYLNETALRTRRPLADELREADRARAAILAGSREIPPATDRPISRREFEEQKAAILALMHGMSNLVHIYENLTERLTGMPVVHYASQPNEDQEYFK